MKKLKDFERQIYEELDLDSELMLIYGDYQNLKEAKELIDRQK